MSASAVEVAKGEGGGGGGGGVVEGVGKGGEEEESREWELGMIEFGEGEEICRSLAPTGGNLLSVSWEGCESDEG